MGRKALNATQLKIIAITAMLLDHIAFRFLNPLSLEYQFMRFIGRMTMPIMCFFLVEGFYKTRNLKKYIVRILIFAILSHFPFAFFMLGKPPIVLDNGIQLCLFPITSVMYTLLLGIFSLCIVKNKRIDKISKVLLVSVLCLLSEYGDWGYTCLLWVLTFGIYYGNYKKQSLWFIMVACLSIITNVIPNVLTSGNIIASLYTLGMFVPITLIGKYNGLKGNLNLKWLFYIFYPLHLFILGLIKYRFI